MKLRIKNTGLTLKIIGWLEILGGVVGLGAVALIMMRTEAITGLMLLLLLIGVFVFSFSVHCGLKLLTDPQKKASVIYSLIIQFIQLIQWAIFGYRMSITAGLSLSVGIDKASLVFNFTVLTSRFSVAIRSGDDVYLKINLVALLIIIVLFDILSERKNAEITIAQESLPLPVSEQNGEI